MCVSNIYTRYTNLTLVHTSTNLHSQEEDNPRLARSKLGSYYERLPDGTNSLFGKDAAVQLRDLKVYHGKVRVSIVLLYDSCVQYIVSTT